MIPSLRPNSTADSLASSKQIARKLGLRRDTSSLTRFLSLSTRSRPTWSRTAARYRDTDALAALIHVGSSPVGPERSKYVSTNTNGLESLESIRRLASAEDISPRRNGTTAASTALDGEADLLRNPRREGHDLDTPVDRFENLFGTPPHGWVRKTTRERLSSRGVHAVAEIVQRVRQSREPEPVARRYVDVRNVGDKTEPMSAVRHFHRGEPRRSGHRIDAAEPFDGFRLPERGLAMGSIVLEQLAHERHRHGKHHVAGQLASLEIGKELFVLLACLAAEDVAEGRQVLGVKIGDERTLH